MALQFSDDIRNARLAAIESTIGTAPVLKIYDLTAGAPANCAATITGTVLATLTLPSDWLTAPSSFSVGKNGTWQDASADASWTADFFRLFASDGTTCKAQGTVGTSATDMIVDNTSINASQSFTVTGFTISEPNG